MLKATLILAILLLITSQGVLGQKTFDAQDFSESYYGKVYLEQSSEVFTNGWIEIYQKKSNKLMLRVEANNLVAYFENDKVKVNVRDLPYGEQSVIIYDDVNFDKIKDFAIKDGNHSCYGGPSYKIFLGTRDKTKFKFNKDFTRLAQEYCGMFYVDNKKKKIKTMTKSGCCWHQYSAYTIQNNKPKPVEIIEEYYWSNFHITDTKTWNGSRMIETQERKFADKIDPNDLILSFELKNKKKVLVYRFLDKLNYALENEEGNVELALPLDTSNLNTVFSVNSKENPTKITFKNYGFTYSIYEKDDNKIGVEVKRKGFAQNLVGIYTSKNGSLKNLALEDLENITFNK